MTRQMIPTGILTRRDDKMLQMDVVAEMTSLQIGRRLKESVNPVGLIMQN